MPIFEALPACSACTQVGVIDITAGIGTSPTTDSAIKTGGKVVQQIAGSRDAVAVSTEVLATVLQLRFRKAAAEYADRELDVSVSKTTRQPADCCEFVFGGPVSTEHPPAFDSSTGERNVAKYITQVIANPMLIKNHKGW